LQQLRPRCRGLAHRSALAIATVLSATASPAFADSLNAVRERGHARVGADRLAAEYLLIRVGPQLLLLRLGHEHDAFATGLLHGGTTGDHQQRRRQDCSAGADEDAHDNASTRTVSIGRRGPAFISVF